MKFFFLSFILGAVLNLFVLFPKAGLAIYPEFVSSIKDIEYITPSIFIQDDLSAFSFRTHSTLIHLKRNGGFETAIPMSGFEGVSGNGQYYIRYTKVGVEIEFYGMQKRFWKQKSREYPYLSYSGRLIFLLNGDQSAVRIINHNGNEIGVKTIAGRVCSVISFAVRGDYGGVGFIDGSYQAVGPDGSLIANGFVSGGIVKSMAISNNGHFVAVHGGDTKSDHIQIFHAENGRTYKYPLAYAHISKTALYISDDGHLVVLDKDRLLFLNKKAGLDFSIAIDEKRDGHASIKENNLAYAVGYTTKRGISKFLLITKKGKIIFKRDFPGESFLDITVDDALIFLRGSDNLYCYSLHEKAE
ncbi:MAG: hypothetical protein FWG92_00815 [Leptospirales bacterium]|nr:hypothetical protein [Leptospirales bacterium]